MREREEKRNETEMAREMKGFLSLGVLFLFDLMVKRCPVFVSTRVDLQRIRIVNCRW